MNALVVQNQEYVHRHHRILKQVEVGNTGRGTGKTFSTIRYQLGRPEYTPDGTYSLAVTTCVLPKRLCIRHHDDILVHATNSTSARLRHWQGMYHGHDDTRNARTAWCLSLNHNKGI